MNQPRDAQRELEREIKELSDQFPALKRDELFVLFFLRAFLTDDLDEAAKALCGGAGDKGTDAVLIDGNARTVILVQGKFHSIIGKKGESRGDVLGFATLGRTLVGPEKDFRSLLESVAPAVGERLEVARSKILRGKFRLSLYYVTTGKCSMPLAEEARRVARTALGEVSFEVFDGRQILSLVTDYFDGVAPPVPALDLELESGKGVTSSGVLRRTDMNSGIESWVFSMSDFAIAALFRQAGRRLFARNVRGFLGSTEINQGMEATLKKEPSRFWYYNNGITIVCDEARHETGHGRDFVRVTNPQVINGQQTTRTLSGSSGTGGHASVLVRVIRVPRVENGAGSEYVENLISRIVAATNWQNAIRPSDLMANDRRQVDIERQLRKHGYWYIRKRQTKGEARRSIASKAYFLVKKEEIAKAVAACEMDPVIVRLGKEGLFEDRLYSAVFPTTDPHFYLTRYRLMREVEYSAKGKPERAYAKWLVLNSVWKRLEPLVKSRAKAEAFRRASEKNEHPVRPLSFAIDHVFKAAAVFFRSKRGSGAEATDVSTFFKRKGRDREFATFWHSRRNKSRTAFDKQWKGFEEKLQEYLEEE